MLPCAALGPVLGLVPVACGAFGPVLGLPLACPAAPLTLACRVGFCEQPPVAKATAPRTAPTINNFLTMFIITSLTKQHR